MPSPLFYEFAREMKATWEQRSNRSSITKPCHVERGMIRVSSLQKITIRRHYISDDERAVSYPQVTSTSRALPRACKSRNEASIVPDNHPREALRVPREQACFYSVSTEVLQFPTTRQHDSPARRQSCFNAKDEYLRNMFRDTPFMQVSLTRKELALSEFEGSWTCLRIFVWPEKRYSALRKGLGSE